MLIKLMLFVMLWNYIAFMFNNVRPELEVDESDSLFFVIGF